MAFESARHAAELASKAIRLDQTGTLPESHVVAGASARLSAVPEGVDARNPHRLLPEFTLGTYGFDRDSTDAGIEGALFVPRAMVEGARRRIHLDR